MTDQLKQSEQTADQSVEQTKIPEVNTVTKKPGRVEAGKRLAEWNRQKKLNQKAKQNIMSEVEQTPKIPEVTKVIQTDQESKSSFLSYKKVAVVAVVGGGGYLLYKLWQSKYKVPETPKPETPKPTNKAVQAIRKPKAVPAVDSFHME